MRRRRAPPLLPRLLYCRCLPITLRLTPLAPLMPLALPPPPPASHVIAGKVITRAPVAGAVDAAAIMVTRAAAQAANVQLALHMRLHISFGVQIFLRTGWKETGDVEPEAPAELGSAGHSSTGRWVEPYCLGTSSGQPA